MSVCCKCTKALKSADSKTYSKCNTTYHYQCLGIPTENFSKESKAYKAAWNCLECKPTDKRGGTSQTPSQQLNTALISASPVTHNIEELKQHFDKKLEESLSKLLRDIKRDYGAESADTRNKIEKLTDSVNFMSAKYDQLREELDSKTKTIEVLEAENKSLKPNLTDVHSRLNHFEQQSRECNVEIQCVPEHRTENLKTVIQQLTTTIGCTLPDFQLLNCRVAKVNQESKRPRSIVIKLSSPLARDNILAAVNTFNKNHPNEKLNSSHLGIAGKEPVYVCEHLSPANKQLHAQARQFAKDKGYQFVWVRYGRIFLRKDINTNYLMIKDSEFLKSLSL